MRRAVRGALVCILCLGAAVVNAEPVTLRIATVAPEGSVFARELDAFTRDVERSTEGRLAFKVYKNGIAGNDAEVGERMRRGQLEGFYGPMLCERAMPSLRVMRLPGMFQTREEAGYVVNRLMGKLAVEAQEAGYVVVATAPLGSDLFFGRRPARTFDELRAMKTWRWDLDSAGVAMSRAMELNIVPLPIEQAGRAFDEGRIDGFWAIPSAAMAWQWSVRAVYLVDLHPSFIYGCLLLRQSAFHAIAAGDQQHVLASAAHLVERLDDATRRMDEALLGGLFQHQGVKTVPVSEPFRAEFFAAANAARDREGPKLVPGELIDRVHAMLSDYRGEHPPARRAR